MRFSTLTVVVVVAHTSTQVIAAPLPIYDDVQELVARADNKNNNKGSSALVNLGKLASRLTEGLPGANSSVRSNAFSIVQKFATAAKYAGASQSNFRAPPMAQRLSSTVQTTGSVQPQFNKNHGSAIIRPVPPSPLINQNASNRAAQSALLREKAAADFKKAKENQRKGPKLMARDLEIDEVD